MRYVVARHCYGGIGDHLSCLMGAWWLAQRTNRTLVVDWRGSRFNPDPSLESNCFSSYFSTRHNIGGVEIIADNSVGVLNYPIPVWPTKWTPSALASPNHMNHDVEEIAHANKLITSELDPLEPTIVLNQWLDTPPHREAVRIFLRDLTPVESIADEALRFWDAHIGKAPAVGIHIRHGNGENLGSRAAYWLGPVALIKQLIINARSDVHKRGIFGKFSDNMPPSLIGTPDQAIYELRFCRRVAEAFHSLAIPNAVPILFSDAAHIVEIMREVLPSVVAKPKREVKRGEGPLHQVNASARQDGSGIRSGTISDEIVFDMFVELDLMRRCSGLVFMDSGFSLLARVSLDENRLIRLRPTLMNRLSSRIVDRMIKDLK
jgi:hypothetical protein